MKYNYTHKLIQSIWKKRKFADFSFNKKQFF